MTPHLRPSVLTTPRTVLALMLREIQASHGRAFGGYLWAAAEPVAGIILLSAIFSLGFRAPPIGNSFALFYATGVLPFAIYRDISGKVAQSVPYSRPLLRYPRVAIADALFARLILSALTQGIVAVAVLGALILWSPTRAMPDFMILLWAFGLTVLLSGGIGCLNGALCGLWPTWARIWAVANRPLFLLSGVFFLFEAVPDVYARWLWFNPLIHLVGLCRRAIFPGYQAAYVNIPFIAATGLASLVLGLILFQRYGRDIIED